MARSYRTLQHWNQWISQQFLGVNLINAEQKTLKKLLAKHFGKHAIIIGVPHQYRMLEATEIPCHTLITPLTHHDKKIVTIESDFHELPVLTGSADLVMLPHTLELVDNPRQLLVEACRIIKPEGLIVVIGFNPYSAWGIKKFFSSTKTQPWEGNFIQAGKVKSWLQLADFQMEKLSHAMYRPPINHRHFFEKLMFLERTGPKFLSILGGAYILLARAKVIPLTPIKMKWKQQLSGIRVTPSISGQIRVLSK